MDFGVIIVSYGNESKLKESISSFESQTKQPLYIQIVDNNSSSSSFLKKWLNESGKYVKYVFEPKHEYGPGAGFSHGLRLALENKEKQADYFVFADENSKVNQDFLEKIESNDVAMKEKGIDVVAFVPSVYLKDDLYLPSHRIVEKSFFKVKESNVNKKIYLRKDFPIAETIFQGLAIKREAALKCGIPNRDFYYGYIDYEYSLRLSELGFIICLTGNELNLDADMPSDRVSNLTYYIIRNRLLTIKKHFSKSAFKSAKVGVYFKYLSLFGKAKYHLFRNKKDVGMIKQAVYDAEDDKEEMNKSYPIGKENL